MPFDPDICIFPALAVLDLRKLAETEDEDDYFELYESPCLVRASNEEFSPEEIDNFAPCNKTYFGGCMVES
jgi:hypothetical protein